jgi:prepilin-type N-terminal cleavage/methylation domain-containing protein
MNKNPSSGFTLIELLVVVAILIIVTTISIVSLDTTRKNSRAAATKKTLSSLKGGIALCCSLQSNSLNTNGGGGDEICSSSINSLLPTVKELSMDNNANVSYLGTACAVTDPGFSVTVTGHAKSECNGTWTIRENSINPPAGC